MSAIPPLSGDKQKSGERVTITVFGSPNLTGAFRSEATYPAGLNRACVKSGVGCMKIIGSVALALFLASIGSCNAQTIVKQEPWEGKMVPGQVILVDDGTCGKGKIKEVTGGELGAMNPRPRAKRCIPKGKM
jgi:hypothetical protein